MIRKYWLHLLLILSVALLLQNCASTGSPSGGPKDITPPKVVTEKSTTNFQTNFFPNKIELVFDEWITLKNQQKEILISPPFFKKPDISYRGKKVTIAFPKDEPLRENATYIIEYGKSVVDFTESNPAEDLFFVFSTGDHIDSMEVSGTVVDAYTGDKVSDVYVFMYDDLNDSIAYEDKPFYFAKTDKNGEFTFKYVKKDSFQIISLDDKNFNYLLDESFERHAFLDSAINLQSENIEGLELALFQQVLDAQIAEFDGRKPGVIQLKLTLPVANPEFQILYPDSFYYYQEVKEDSVFLWYTDPLDSVGLIYKYDTLDIRLPEFEDSFYKRKIKAKKAEKINVAPFDTLGIFFTSPISTIDTSLIYLTNMPVRKEQRDTSKAVDTLSEKGAVDTLNRKDIQKEITPDTLLLVQDTIVQDSVIEDIFGDSTFQKLVDFDLRELKIIKEWEEDKAYRLIIDSFAIVDIYGRSNPQIIIDFKTDKEDQYENISLALSNIDSMYQYVIELMSNSKVVRKAIWESSDTSAVTFERMKIGNYQVRVIEDRDGNGEWTTGSYSERRQPERIKEYNLNDLVSDWELVLTLSWKEEEETPIDTMNTEIPIDSLNLKLPLDSLEIKD